MEMNFQRRLTFGRACPILHSLVVSLRADGANLSNNALLYLFQMGYGSQLSHKTITKQPSWMSSLSKTLSTTRRRPSIHSAERVCAVPSASKAATIICSIWCICTCVCGSRQ
jgi:hypothetical protein